MLHEIMLDSLALQSFCRRWMITELSFFGSVLREDFRPASDVDVLVTYAESAPWSLMDEIEMIDQLEAILRRKVDLVSRQAVETSHNWIRRQNILENARVIYAAR